MFALGPTPDEPMDIVEAEIPLPTIHLYNGKDHAQPWISKTTAIGRVLVPLKEIPNRPGIPEPDYGGYFKAAIPKMPQAILNQALAFFRFALKANKSEAAVLIALDENDAYHLYCPEQEVDYTGVDWRDNIVLEDGHYLMGSIHSHCDFSAFHSGTDESDAARNDGLHITIGHIDQDLPEVDTMIAFSGVKWQKWPLTNYLEGEDWSPPAADDQGQYDLFPDDWLEQLKEPKPVYAPTKWTPPTKKTSNYNPGYSESWIDDEWDDEDWDLYSYYHGSRHERSTDPREPARSTHRIERINSTTRWYSTDDEMCQDQILHDMKELVLMADAVGLTITFTVQQRTLLPELTEETGHGHTASK